LHPAGMKAVVLTPPAPWPVGIVSSSVTELLFWTAPLAPSKSMSAV